MKIKIWLFVSNNGDGSAAVRLFPSEQAAEGFANFNEETDSGSYDRMEDDIQQIEFEIDEKGNILQPALTKIVNGILYENYSWKHGKNTYICQEKTDWSYNDLSHLKPKELKDEKNEKKSKRK